MATWFAGLDQSVRNKRVKMLHEFPQKKILIGVSVEGLSLLLSPCPLSEDIRVPFSFKKFLLQ
jgi:hypothetical protein